MLVQLPTEILLFSSNTFVYLFVVGAFFLIFSMCVFCCLYYYLTGICMHVWKLFPYGCLFLCPLFAFPLCIAACFPVCVPFPSPHPAARLHFSNGQAASFLAARLLFFFYFSLCWVSFNPSQYQQYHQLVLTCKKCRSVVVENRQEVHQKCNKKSTRPRDSVALNSNTVPILCLRKKNTVAKTLQGNLKQNEAFLHFLCILVCLLQQQKTRFKPSARL